MLYGGAQPEYRISLSLLFVVLLSSFSWASKLLTQINLVMGAHVVTVCLEKKVLLGAHMEPNFQFLNALIPNVNMSADSRLGAENSNGIMYDYFCVKGIQHSGP